MAPFTYTTSNEGKVKLLAEALRNRGHAYTLSQSEPEEIAPSLTVGSARPFHLRVDSQAAEEALRRLLSPAGDSVGPFPSEPAPGSPEAVEQAAEKIRLREENERLAAMHVRSEGEGLALRRQVADLQAVRPRRHPAEYLLAQAEEQRDALADALEGLLQEEPSITTTSNNGPSAEAWTRWHKATKASREALRKAGR